jgi:hypothetical protein
MSVGSCFYSLLKISFLYEHFSSKNIGHTNIVFVRYSAADCLQSNGWFLAKVPQSRPVVHKKLAHVFARTICFPSLFFSFIYFSRRHAVRCS